MLDFGNTQGKGLYKRTKRWATTGIVGEDNEGAGAHMLYDVRSYLSCVSELPEDQQPAIFLHRRLLKQGWILGTSLHTSTPRGPPT